MRICTKRNDDRENILIGKRAIRILWIFSPEMRTNNPGMRTSRISYLVMLTMRRSSLA
jgi:hypothetical protein